MVIERLQIEFNIKVMLKPEVFLGLEIQRWTDIFAINQYGYKYDEIRTKVWHSCATVYKHTYGDSALYKKGP